MVELVITLSLQQACIVEMQTQKEVECFTITHGKDNTPKGVFYIDQILLNPLPIHPVTGDRYPASQLYKVITTSSPDVFIHGWHNPNQIGRRVSLGCVSLENDNVDKLIFEYLFNKIIIK